MDLNALAQRAQRSAGWAWVMNRVLWRMVPFNRPHGLRVQSLTAEKVRVFIPFKRTNKNHLHGLHACVMLTAAEYASGLLLLYNLSPKKYRLIMKHIEAEYTYQGKMEAFAEFSLPKADLEDSIVQPLQSEGKIERVCEIPVVDKEGNTLCTVRTTWQIKAWKQVSTPSPSA